MSASHTTEIAVSLGGMPEASEFEAFLVFRTGVKVSVAFETPTALRGGEKSEMSWRLTQCCGSLECTGVRD